MSKLKIPRGGSMVAAMSLLVAGLAGCNRDIQSPDQETSREPVTRAPGELAGPEGLMIGEGRKLEGADLKNFLDRHASEERPHKAEAGTAALPKVAAQSCMVDFNSSIGLSNMSDRAYTAYATAPWYYQPCGNGYNTYVIPINRNFYYLTTEASGTCPGTYGKIGYGTYTNCQNQANAAYFPRRASNGSTTDGVLGLWAYMYQGNTSKSFNLNSLRVVSGSVYVYAYRNGIGWWWWGPLTGNINWTFPNGQNVREVKIHASDNANVYVVDDISLTGL